MPAAPADTSPDGGEAGLPSIPGTPAATGLSLTVPTDRAFVVQGNTVMIPVSIQRKANTNEPVRIDVTGLPAGATAPSLLIQPSFTDGMLAITTMGSTPQGSVDVALAASSTDGSAANGKALIFVRGVPGSIDTTFVPDALFPITGQGNATLTQLSDGSMILASQIGATNSGEATGRLVKLDAAGKTMASSDMGIGARVTIMPDGRIMNFGPTRLARFSSTLVRDTAFNGGSGNVFLNVGTVSGVFGLADKSIVMSNRGVTNGANSNFFLDITRWTIDGQLDSGFTRCEFAAFTDQSFNLGNHPLAVNTDGTSAAIFSISDENGSSGTYGCSSTGAVNLGGANQASILSLGTNHIYGELVADGVGGYFATFAGATSNVPPSLGHITAAGAQDVPFATSQIDAEVRPALAVQPDGLLVIAGTLSTPSNRPLGVRRYMKNAVADQGFTHAETAASPAASSVDSLVIQKDGRIVVLAGTGTLRTLVLLRYWG